MQRTGAVCQKAAAPLKAIGVTVSEESIRAYLEDRTDGEPRAAVASSGGPGHQLSYLRGAETALLRLTLRNTKKSDSYSDSQLPDGSTASTITVVH